MKQAPIDAAIARLSRTQHGAWSRGQVFAAGGSGSLIDRRLRSGAWVKLDTAVYGSPSVHPTWQRSVMAGVLAEPWAVASHRSAAVLHQLVGFRQGRPEITTRPGANVRGQLAIAHRGVDVRTTKIQGIPCVTLDHVFVDLAQVIPQRKLQVALARCADGNAAALEAVRDRFVALAPRGGRNLSSLRSVLDGFGAGEAIDESELERRARLLFTRTGVPPIVWQAPFPGRVPGAHRADGVIETWKIVLEGDGRAWHTRIDDFERDRRRDQGAAAAGYLTLRYTYNQITTEPDWCLTTLLAAGSRRC